MGFFDNIPGMWARRGAGGGRGGAAPTRSGSHAGSLVGDVQTSPVTSSVPTRAGSQSGNQIGGYVQQRQSLPSAQYATRGGVGGMRPRRRGDTPTPGPRTGDYDFSEPSSSSAADAYIGAGSGEQSQWNPSLDWMTPEVRNAALSVPAMGGPMGPPSMPSSVPWKPGAEAAYKQQQELGWQQDYTDFINSQWALQFGMAAPAFAAFDAQEARARDMLSRLDSQYGRRSTNLHREYGFDMRDLGLRDREIGIDRGENQADRDLFNALKGTARESFDNDIAQIRSKADQERLLTDSEYIGRGAWFSPRRQTKQGWIDESQEQSEKDRQIGFRESILNLDRKLTGTRARDAKLDIMAERVGIDRDRLRERLDFGLAQLGWDKYTNTNQLLDQLDGLDASRYDAIMQILTSIIQASNNWDGGQVGDQMTNAGG